MCAAPVIRSESIRSGKEAKLNTAAIFGDAEEPSIPPCTEVLIFELKAVLKLGNTSRESEVEFESKEER